MKHCIKHSQQTIALLGLGQPTYWSLFANASMINSDREPVGGSS